MKKSIAAAVAGVPVVALGVLLGLGSGTPALAAGSVATQSPVAVSLQQRDMAAEIAYMQEVNPILEATTASFARFTDLITLPQIGNAAWEAALQDEGDIWSASYAQLSVITPPAALAEYHDALVSSYSLFNEAGIELIPAIQNSDVAGMDRGLALWEEGGDEFKQAQTLFLAYAE